MDAELQYIIIIIIIIIRPIVEWLLLYSIVTIK